MSLIARPIVYELGSLLCFLSCVDFVHETHPAQMRRSCSYLSSFIPELCITLTFSRQVPCLPTCFHVEEAHTNSRLSCPISRRWRNVALLNFPRFIADVLGRSGERSIIINWNADCSLSMDALMLIESSPAATLAARTIIRQTNSEVVLFT